MNFDNEFDFGISDSMAMPVNRSQHELDRLSSQISHMRLSKAAQISTNSLSDGLSSPLSRLSYTASVHSDTSDVPATSNYWQVPDNQSYLTSIAMQKDSNLCAIGSGSTKSNLFLYEVYPDEVTHHQTVTLPEIHSLKWVSSSTQLGQMGNVLASGHRNGYVHLTLLPDSTARDQNAEILKRYNHSKHLSLAQHPGRSLRIRNLQLSSAAWKCCAAASLFTLCGDHLFLWEPNRSDIPLVIQKTNSTNAIGLCESRDGVYALGRRRGVCIRDIRIRDRINSGLKPPIGNNESVSLVEWNSYDDGNQLAAVHDRRTIKIWDIRSKEPLASYTRHADTITSLKWSSKSELVSASCDGTLRVWDTENSPSDEEPLHSKSPQLCSTWTDYQRRQAMDVNLEGFTSDLLRSVTPVNQPRHFVDMEIAQMGPSLGAITIDSDCFLGVHELNDSKNLNKFSFNATPSFDFSCEHDYLTPTVC